MWSRKSEHKVYIYNNDYQSLCTEVYRHQEIETGGNLFGLWTTSGSAVIHVLLGPGEHCRRTSTSFHQDIKYMERVGRFVNSNYMLCHIGEWHSHHRLSLSKPSVGDEQTIQRNFPAGMDKFLVIIANIVGRQGDQITLSPYFFTDNGRCYKKAEWEVLPTVSPFSNDKKILAQIELGAETIWQRPKSPNKEVLVEVSSQAGKTGTPHPSISNPPQVSSHVNIPPPDYPGSPDSQVNPVNPSSPDPQVNSVSSTEEPMDTSNDELVIPTSSDANQKTSADDSKLTKKEIVLRKTHDALKKWFGCEPDMEHSSSGVVEIKFEHANRYWMIQFPEDFPKAPAKLFCSFLEARVRRNECSYNIVKPLVNDVNILLSMKNECSRSCHVCKHFTKESLSQSEVNPSSREKLTATAIELMENINREIGVDSFNSQLRPSNSYEITFKHENWSWLIEIPAAYPEKPAKVYKLFHERSPQKFDALVYGNTTCGPVHLNTSELIIKAIYLQCACAKCFELKTRDKQKSK